MPVKPELLAPAGDMDSLVAAVENGCDAVYFGARTMSARASAENFATSDLAFAIEYAHLRGVRAYVTVNTLVKDSEIADATDLLRHLDESGADAVIVQDMGLLAIALSQVPGLPIHASTQMTVHNSEGVRFLQDMGVKRVVLARELELDEVRRIKENSGLEIEVFVHGALCISYSGQCLASSMIGGRSGNRGHCAQPCRRKYRLRVGGRTVSAADTGGEYLLSPKDLNASLLLPELFESGVDSIKIEGRLKRPEYVACTVGIYRRLIDRCAEDLAGYFVSDDEYRSLAQIFNRGFTTGYLGGNPHGDLMSSKSPRNRGIAVGTVTGYDRRRMRLRVKLTGRLNSGDGIGIGFGVKAGTSSGTSPGEIEAGMVVRGMHAGGVLVDHAGSGTIVDIPCNITASIPAGSVVYRTLDRRLTDALRRTFTSPAPIRRVPITITAEAVVGSPFELQIMDCDGNAVSVYSEYVVERAVNAPTTKEQIVRQLGRLGNTVFEASAVDVTIGAGADAGIAGGVFIPVRQLNRARNDAVSELAAARIRWAGRAGLRPRVGPARTGSPYPEDHEKSLTRKENGGRGGAPSTARPLTKPLLAVSVDTLIGVQKAISGGADAIYFGGEQFRGMDTRDTRDAGEAVRYVHRMARLIYLKTPRIARDCQMSSAEETLLAAEALGSDGVVVSNLGVFRLASEMGLNTIVDSPLNVFNQRSLRFWADRGAGMVTLSPELNIREVRRIAAHGAGTGTGAVECIVHGRLTLTVSEHCVVGGISGCDSGRTAPDMACEAGCFELVDEKGYAFPLVMDTDCRTHLLNSSELCMLDRIPEIVRSGVASIRIEAVASAIAFSRLEEIVRLYRDAIDGCCGEGKSGLQKRCPDITGGGGYTTGHYRRGVL